MSATPVFIALIRTHHITSRKKVAKLRAAASKHSIYALLHYGGCPGIMYCQGAEAGVRGWVTVVQRLRYKDYHLAKKPGLKVVESGVGTEVEVVYGKVEQVQSVGEFGARMEVLGVHSWWRVGMGYVGEI